MHIATLERAQISVTRADDYLAISDAAHALAEIEQAIRALQQLRGELVIDAAPAPAAPNSLDLGPDPAHTRPSRRWWRDLIVDPDLCREAEQISQAMTRRA